MNWPKMVIKVSSECFNTFQTIAEAILEIDINTLDRFVETLKRKVPQDNSLDEFKDLKNRGAHGNLIHKVSMLEKLLLVTHIPLKLARFTMSNLFSLVNKAGAYRAAGPNLILM